MNYCDCDCKGCNSHHSSSGGDSAHERTEPTTEEELAMAETHAASLGTEESYPWSKRKASFLAGLQEGKMLARTEARELADWIEDNVAEISDASMDRIWKKVHEFDRRALLKKEVEK